MEDTVNLKKEIKLIALDMDGTLFNKKNEISQEDQKAIKEAIAFGTEVVISTGRPYVGIPVGQLAELGIRYAITVNGAAIYRLPERECIYSECIKPECIVPVIRELLKKDVHFDVFIDGDAYSQSSRYHLIDSLQLPEANKKYIKTTRTMLDDMPAYIEKNQCMVQKVTVNFYPLPDGNYQDYEAVRTLLDGCQQLTCVSGGFHNLEFTKAGVTKGKALRILAEKTGIQMNQTMACGDSENDLDIIKAAEIGVAMQNAAEEVKRAADFVTMSNEASGIAYAIRQLVQRK